MKRKRRLPIAKPEFPPMRCDDGSGECCGPAPATQAELDRVVEYVIKNKLTPKDQGLTCPLYLNGRCSVYEVRPLVCRAFGHVDGMNCARGYNTNIPSNGQPETHTFYPSKLKIALEFMARRYSTQFAQLKGGNYDGSSGDLLLQLMAFGPREVKYG